MIDEGDRVVELYDPDGWHRTTFRDVQFLENVLGKQQYREIEGSVDGGMTWKTRYEEEMLLLGIVVCEATIWRVKHE